MSEKRDDSEKMIEELQQSYENLESSGEFTEEELKTMEMKKELFQEFIQERSRNIDDEE